MPDHDELFKELIEELYFELLELFLPHDFVNTLDRTFRVSLDKELPADIGPGKSHRADIVSKVQILPAKIPMLIHIEIESSCSKEFPERMLYYYAGLRKKYKLEVLPIAIFAFTTPRGLQPCMVSSKIADCNILRFEFKRIQLNTLNWRDYLSIKNPVVPALMPLMRYNDSERVDVRLNSILRFGEISEAAETPLSSSQISIVRRMIDSYSPLTPSEKLRFNEKLEELNPNLKGTIMNYITSWERDGALQNAREMARDLLTSRFGDIDTEILDEVDELSAEKLKTLPKAIFGFSSPNDVVIWLKS
jgi:hypothetical protein